GAARLLLRAAPADRSPGRCPPDPSNDRDILQPRARRSAQSARTAWRALHRQGTHAQVSPALWWHDPRDAGVSWRSYRLPRRRPQENGGFGGIASALAERSILTVRMD